MPGSLITSLAVACAFILILMPPPVQATEVEVLAALESFIAAFEDGDIEAMEASFSHNAVTFPRSIMAHEYDGEIEVSKYRRVRGIDPQMRELIDSLRKSGRERPYLDIKPVDLEIQVFGDAALVTFHLVGGERLGRRTFVLALIDDAWKIVHLHASNVYGARPKH
jgi:ketosteroid isomerase-like protein